MTATFTETRFKGSPEEIEAQWLEARRNGIGGSDAAAVLGVSKYATPLTVWLDKTGRDTGEFEENESMYWGRELEDTVAKEFAKRHPDMKVKRKNALLRSKAWPWMLASVDRIVIDADGRKGILEIKTCDKALADDWAETVPDYYFPQPTHYLAVTGYDFFAVAVLIGGNRYKEYFFDRDQGDIEALVSREEDFWHGYVLADVMPAATGKDADRKAVFAMHPEPSDEYVLVHDLDLPDLAEYEELGRKIKADEERRAEIANNIKVMVGDAKGIETNTRKVTWTRSMTSMFDKKRFMGEHPELFNEYEYKQPRDGGLRITEVR